MCSVLVDIGIAILIGQETILDFIAWPKKYSGHYVMIDATSPIDDKQLEELIITLNIKS